MEELTISQIAHHAAIRPSTIRYYESINLLPSPRRTSGQRRYDAGILHRLAFIKTAQSLGFTLTEIQAFFDSSPEHVPISSHWQTLAQDKLAEVQNILHETITGNRIVKAFGMEAWEAGRYRKAAQRFFRLQA